MKERERLPEYGAHNAQCNHDYAADLHIYAAHVHTAATAAHPRSDHAAAEELSPRAQEYSMEADRKTAVFHPSK
jgi:hypothetical protein